MFSYFSSAQTILDEAGRPVSLVIIDLGSDDDTHQSAGKNKIIFFNLMQIYYLSRQWYYSISSAFIVLK